MTTCCTRRERKKLDGVIDEVEIDRAVRGQHATLSPDEAKVVFWRLSHERGWGPGRISVHTGYSKSHVAAELAKGRPR